MHHTDYHEKLNELAQLLEGAEAELPRSWQRDHESHLHCDEWCKLWMLLAGAWYSLSWAANPLEERVPLTDALPQAHAIAREFLASFPPKLTASDMNPWFTGYFMISAEHRIANTIDRATTLFFWPLRAPDKIYNRCVALLTRCPHCAMQVESYLPKSTEILRYFGAHPSMVGGSIDTWTAGSNVARVYHRVNTIKHKKPDADAVSDLATAQRWRDVASAVSDVALLMQDLTRHWLADETKRTA